MWLFIGITYRQQRKCDWPGNANADAEDRADDPVSDGCRVSVKICRTGENRENRGVGKIENLKSDPNNATHNSRFEKTSANEAAKLIKTSIMAAIIKADPRAQEAAINNRKNLIALFREPFFVEEIPIISSLRPAKNNIFHK